MGTKMGPSYANLFVGYIEHQFFNQYNGPKPDLYTSLAFLDIKVSVEGNGLCTSVHYKPTDSHSKLICCIHLHIHHNMSRILFLILSFLDFVAFVVKTLISS